MDDSNSIDNPVASHLSGIVHQDIQPGLYSRPDDHHFMADDLLHGTLYRTGDRRDHRGNDAPVQILNGNAVKLQNIFKTDGILQFGPGGNRGQPFHKTDILPVDASDDDVCISDIYCKYHDVLLL